jgi:phage-related protein
MKQILSIALILSMIGLGIQVYSTCKAQKEMNDYKEQVTILRFKNDSLYSELYPAQNELDRHIEALHIFLKRNRKAAEQYADIISDETE